MAITFVDANCTATEAFTTNASPTIALPGTVASGALLLLGIRNSTDETTTITSVTDSVNGAWSGVVSGPTDMSTGSVQRSWYYYFENSGSGSITITVNFSGAITGALIAGWAEGARTSGVLDAADATPDEVNVSGTNHDSGTLTATAAGALIGLLVCSANVTITMDGAGETNVSNAAGRLHFAMETYASAGDYHLEATTSGNAISHFHVGAFKEDAAGRATKNTRPFPLGRSLGTHRGIGGLPV